MSDIVISIIIATRNREQILWQTVQHASDAACNKPAEIIVVNDGDISLQVPAAFTTYITVLDNPKKGVSSARNYGASISKGEFLFFVDDDMWIDAAALDWINDFLVKDKKAPAVYNLNWEYPPSLQQKLHSSKVGNYILAAGYNTMWGRMHVEGVQPATGLYKFTAIASCSLVMDRSTFESLHGYNEHMIFQGEDIDLSDRINEAGYPVFCVFDITLYHNHQDRLDIESFLERLCSGFSSEFKAVQAGILRSHADTNYSSGKKIAFDFLQATEKFWIAFLKIMPAGIFSKFNNRMLGGLSALQQYKEWKKIGD